MSADTVRIRELSAHASDRLLTWSEDGVPRLGHGPHWFDPDYDDRHWQTGAAPFGYGVGVWGTDLRDEMFRLHPSLYIRQGFEVSAPDAARTNLLVLYIEFNDGFVARLNGREIARRNMGPPHLFAWHDQEAFNGIETETLTLDLGPADGWLQEGENLLAIQGHNVRAADFTFELYALLYIEDPILVVAGVSDWSYRLGSSEPSGGVYDPTVSDGFEDWVELVNTGAAPVSLSGWHLTDDEDEPMKWPLPDIVLTNNEHLLVLCSGHESAPSNALYVHASFKLDAGGEFLGLFNPTGLPVSVVDVPPQPAQFSYGRHDESETWRFFAEPTPGRSNVGGGWLGVLPEPALNLPPGFYDTNLNLEAESEIPGTVLRYTLDGREPDTNSLIFSGALHLTTSRVVRVRAFKPDWIPSPILTRTYLLHEPMGLRHVPVVALTGDAERALFQPEGVTSIVGGSWNNLIWTPDSMQDYNIPIKRGRPHE
ncbi:MAG: chitobiase/beta-hexosaminidase C-terminal domain-containing protein, partial [Verrucomicrobiota bacterium]